MKAIQHKPNLKRAAVLLFGIMMTCATVKAQDTPCLPSHGETDNQSAWCGGIPQTIALVAGYNWFSTNHNITVDDLKAALVEALPGATSIKILAQNGKTLTYNGSIWRGSGFVWNVTQMYIIQVPSDAELTLQGEPLNPAESPASIVSGYNWIGFPLSESITVANAFANFDAVANDKVSAQNGKSKTYNGTQWRTGQLNNLDPGQGYIFNSASTSSTPRTLTFPTSNAK